MAYETGTSSGEADLLAKIHTFAVANGYTSHRNTATDICVAKDNLYQNIHIDGSGVFSMQPALGFNSGQVWNNQPSAASVEQLTSGLVGYYTAYHLFTNVTNDYIHIVVEVDPGVFKHMLFGLLKKTSVYTGGEYSLSDYGVNSSMFSAIKLTVSLNNPKISTVRASYDGITNPWLGFTEVNVTSTSAPKYQDRRATGAEGKASSRLVGLNKMFHIWETYSPTTFNSVVPFAPIYIFAERDDDKWSPLGSVKDVRFVSIADINPNSEITIGSDTWIVFPETVKSVSNTTALAYKKLI